MLKGCSYFGELARLGGLARLSETSPSLKVVSATFLLVCFLCLTESTCKTRKNTFYFTLKALLVLEKINFWHFRYSNIMTSSNAQAWNTKHTLVNNFGKQMQSGNEIWSVYGILQNSFFIKKLWKRYGLKTSSRPFIIYKESSVKKILWRSACWFG